MNYKERSFACEKAIAFLHRYMVDNSRDKPVIFHGVRVGTDLFCHGYAQDIDKNIQREDMIKRCITTGEAATIVKAGDILDNMMYYTMTEDYQQLSRHCLLTAKLLLQKLPDTYTDVIFTRLKKKTQEIQSCCFEKYKIEEK